MAKKKKKKRVAVQSRVTTTTVLDKEQRSKAGAFDSHAAVLRGPVRSKAGAAPLR